MPVVSNMRLKNESGQGILSPAGPSRTSVPRGIRSPPPRPEQQQSPEPVLKGIKIRVDDGRDIEGQQLGKDEASHHRKPQRPARFRPGAETDRDGKGAHESGHRRHHDRPEPDDGAFVNRILRALPFLPFGFEGEIDHHDRILFDYPDEHDDAHESVDVQLLTEDQERQERTHPRGRKTGEYGKGMDEAFVENAENDIDNENGHDEQEKQSLRRRLEGLRRTLKTRRYRRRKRLA